MNKLKEKINKLNSTKYAIYSWIYSILLVIGLQNVPIAFASKQSKATDAISKDAMGFLNAMIVFSILTSVLLLVIHGVRMAKHGNSETKRKEANNGMLVVIICSACLGGFSLIGKFVVQLIFF